MKLLLIFVISIYLSNGVAQDISEERIFKCHFSVGYANYFEGIREDVSENNINPNFQTKLSRIDSAYFGNGITAGIVLDYKRWSFPISVGITFWNLNMTAEKHTVAFGQFITRRFVRYKGVAFYGDLSLGASYNLIQKSKFQLAPIVQFNPELRFGENLSDSLTKVISDDYYYFENSKNNVEIDSKPFSGFNRFIRSLQPSVGINIEYRINNRVGFLLELGVTWQHFSRLSFDSYHRSSFGSYGRVSFKFLLQKKSNLS